MGILAAPGLDDLLVNVRTFLGQPDSTNSFWSDDELTVYLNEGIRRYFQEIIKTGGGQFVVQVDLDLVAGNELVALPADFFQAKGVYRKQTDGYLMMRWMNNLTMGYSTSQQSGNALLPSYDFRSTNLVLRPIPGAAETAGLRMEYIAFPATLLTGGDSMTAEVSPVFRDLIECYAIYKAKLRESSVNGVNTYAPIKENLSDLMVAFRDSLARRSMNPTHTVAFNPEVF